MSIANRLGSGVQAVSPPAGPPDEGPTVPPAIARCLSAFARDLPALLESHPRRWVAYADGSQVRIADTQTELYRYCLQDLGLEHDRFIVACIAPDAGGKVEYTLR